MSPSHHVLVYSKLSYSMESTNIAIHLPTHVQHVRDTGYAWDMAHACSNHFFQREWTRLGHHENMYGNTLCQKTKTKFVLAIFSKQRNQLLASACFSLKLQISLLYLQIAEVSLPFGSLPILVFISISLFLGGM